MFASALSLLAQIYRIELYDSLSETSWISASTQQWARYPFERGPLMLQNPSPSTKVKISPISTITMSSTVPCPKCRLVWRRRRSLWVLYFISFVSVLSGQYNNILVMSADFGIFGQNANIVVLCNDLPITRTSRDIPSDLVTWVTSSLFGALDSRAGYFSNICVYFELPCQCFGVWNQYAWVCFITKLLLPPSCCMGAYLGQKRGPWGPNLGLLDPSLALNVYNSLSRIINKVFWFLSWMGSNLYLTTCPV